MIRIPQEIRNLTSPESQQDQLLDAREICITLAFLNGAFRLAHIHSLKLFCRKRFFGTKAEQISLQFSKQGKYRDHNFTVPVVLKDVEVLFSQVVICQSLCPNTALYGSMTGRTVYGSKLQSSSLACEGT